MPVKIILKEDIEKLGEAGEIVNVKPGFARNYLFPKGAAVLATFENLLTLKDEREKIKEEASKKRANAEEQRAIIMNLGRLEIAGKIGPTGKLFGRITAADIVELLEAKGVKVEKKFVSIEGFPRGIDELGSYNVSISLGYSVRATIELIVSEATA